MGELFPVTLAGVALIDLPFTSPEFDISRVQTIVEFLWQLTNYPLVGFIKRIYLEHLRLLLQRAAVHHFRGVSHHHWLLACRHSLFLVDA